MYTTLPILLIELAGAAAAATMVNSYWERQKREASQRMMIVSLVESANDAIIGKTIDGTVLYWNRAAENLFGYSASTAVGKKVVDLIIPSERTSEELDILARASCGEIVPHFETTRLHASGRSIDVSVTVSPIYSKSGKIIGASKTIRDITKELAAQRAFSQAQSVIALTAQIAGVGIWELDIHCRQVTWNATMRDIYGNKDGQSRISFQKWLRSVDPRDVNDLENSIRLAFLHKSAFTANYRIITATNEVKYISAKGHFTFDEYGEIKKLLGISFDATAQLTHENEIRELNEKLERDVKARTSELEKLSSLQRTILRDSAHAIIATDIDGIITLFNPSAENLLGHKASEVVGKTSPEIFHSFAEVEHKSRSLTEEFGRFIEPGFGVFVEKAKMGIVDSNEWTYIRKDGSTFPIWLTVTALLDKNSNIFGFLGMAVDLSEQKEKDQALRENERFLKAVTEKIPSLIGYWDANLQCRFVNSAYEKWFGRNRNDLYGCHLSEFLASDMLEANTPYIEKALLGEEQHFQHDFLKVDGTIAHTWAHYIPDIDGNIVRGFYVLVSDITELKQTERALEAVNQVLQAKTVDLEAATSMKSQFLANMSHEIRSPMNAILGMLQLLSKTDLTRQQIHFTNMARKATESLLHLLNDILDLSKIEAGKIDIESAQFCVKTVVADVASLFYIEAFKKGIELVVSVDKHISQHLIGDALRLKQVLINIVGNAIKFTDSGEVAIDATVVERSDDTSFIEFSVRDTGIGIPAEKLAIVFRSFSQAEASTSRKYGGSGLGLTICSQLIPLMGGKLEVRSEVGTGSIFSFVLPFADLDTGVSSIPEKTVASENICSVLCIEDNAADRLRMTEIIDGFGWHGDLVASIDEAVDLLTCEKQERHYDIIVLASQGCEEVDFTLPPRFAQLLRRQEPNPTILLAVLSPDTVTEKLDRFDVYGGFLRKPYTSSSVLNGIIQSGFSRKAIDSLDTDTGDENRLDGIRILVVDDNDINLEIAYELLTHEGADMHTADSGMKAIEILESDLLKIHVVLMDVQMPLMDGYETTQRIRQLANMQNLPIIAMTANAMDHEKILCLQAGMDDHVAKPIHVETVVQTILRHATTEQKNSLLPTVTEDGFSTEKFIESSHSLARIGHDKTLLSQVVSQSMDQMSAFIQEIRAFVQIDKVDLVADRLQRLKKIAATVGNLPLYDAVCNLENALRESSVAACSPEAMAQLDRLLNAGNKELIQIMKNKNSALTL